MLALSLAVLASLAGSAVAHGGLANYTVGDTWYRGYDPDEDPAEQLGQAWMIQRQWASINPIFDVLDPFLACNNPGTPPPSYIPIRAGDNITAVYWYWLHPVGPMTVWLAACGDSCINVDPATVQWFKIWEAGLLSGNVPEGMWYQKQFQNWDGSPDLWPVTIPLNLKPGLYMIRHEILSIHIENKPQFYPECAHLNVSGTGHDYPPEDHLKTFPGAYSPFDPSINIDIYTDEMKNTTTYEIPGGPIWDGFAIRDKYCLGC
ncbi:hypothetical protein DL546_003220 [Coniochaeta pulveracea]|uniref:lytic cellulose monooxygenase (C4-dehydrogenating) n=1 Tax=Coniochaeta pulveracea TaxID=177199 RepID=A0A420Y053_9PEZI|nr:hypothetical protein DL546_003220 [Coniochaeta pulveracea]